jgi:hypothetical protein
VSTFGDQVEGRAAVEIIFYIRVLLTKPLVLALFLIVGFASTTALGFSANKVWMEFRDNGRYRIYVQYTNVPLKRLGYTEIEYSTKGEAEKTYFALAKGADFFFGSDQRIKFTPPKLKPTPW